MNEKLIQCISAEAATQRLQCTHGRAPLTINFTPASPLEGIARRRLPQASGSLPSASILRKYSALEKALVANRFACAADKRDHTVDGKAPLPLLRNQKPTWMTAAALARHPRLNSARRCDGDGAAI